MFGNELFEQLALGPEYHSTYVLCQPPALNQFAIPKNSIPRLLMLFKKGSRCPKVNRAPNGLDSAHSTCEGISLKSAQKFPGTDMQIRA